METKKTYKESILRLEEIVSKIENGDMDIDSLAENLKEAKELINFCKAKLLKVEEEVNNIIKSDDTSA